MRDEDGDPPFDASGEAMPENWQAHYGRKGGLLFAAARSDLPGAALRVLITLVHRANAQTGIAWPSRAKIVDDTGLSVAGVRKALRTLHEAGWISCFRRDRAGELHPVPTDDRGADGRRYSRAYLPAWDRARTFSDTPKGYDREPFRADRKGERVSPFKGSSGVIERGTIRPLNLGMEGTQGRDPGKEAVAPATAVDLEAWTDDELCREVRRINGTDFGPPYISYIGNAYNLWKARKALKKAATTMENLVAGFDNQTQDLESAEAAYCRARASLIEEIRKARACAEAEQALREKELRHA